MLDGPNKPTRYMREYNTNITYILTKSHALHNKNKDAKDSDGMREEN